MSDPASRADNSRRRALLLDFDGTLADTLPGLRTIYGNFLNEINALDKAPSFADVNGANLCDLIQRLCREHAPDRDAATEWRNYWSCVEQSVLDAAPVDGAHRIVAWARQQGWLIGIGSASRTDVISGWLARNTLEHAIDCIVGSDLCDRGKPDPAIYRALLARLGVDKADCIVIEDSASGVASANGAGIGVIRLTGDTGSTDTVAAYNAATLGAALEYLQTRFGPMRKL